MKTRFEERHHYKATPFLKRTLDLIVSLFLLCLVFPAMILLALLVKLDSEGPIFYRQVRVGVNIRRFGRRAASRRGRPFTIDEDERRQMINRRDENTFGRPFEVIKFRTMCSRAEATGQAVWCRPNDPRVTRVGRFLRTTHIDELPQLINVLKGEMSLVGPRPERPEFVTTLVLKIPKYSQRLVLRPGLTGLAQIRHRADLVLDDVKRKIRYDLLYLRRASMSTDLKIILGTVPIVLGLNVMKWKGLKKARRFLRVDRLQKTMNEPQTTAHV